MRRPSLQTTHLNVMHIHNNLLSSPIDGNVSMMVKIQIIQSEEEMHSLSQDLARILSHSDTKDEYVDCIVECAKGRQSHKTLQVHSLIIRARSPALASLLREKNTDNNVSSL